MIWCKIIPFNGLKPFLELNMALRSDVKRCSSRAHYVDEIFVLTRRQVV